MIFPDTFDRQLNTTPLPIKKLRAYKRNFSVGTILTHSDFWAVPFYSFENRMNSQWLYASRKDVLGIYQSDNS